MAIIGMILSDSKKYNTEKILKMILLHDLAESVTGDFTPEQIPAIDKKRLENKTMAEILSNLPEEIQDQYLKIWDEYQDSKTADANFVHQIDKFEMALQAKIYEKQTNPEKTKVFLESAKKEITDENLVKMLEKLCGVHWILSENSKDELIEAQKQVIGILFEVIKRLQANNDLDEEYFQIISDDKKTKQSQERLESILNERAENAKIVGRLLAKLED